VAGIAHNRQVMLIMVVLMDFAFPFRAVLTETTQLVAEAVLVRRKVVMIVIMGYAFLGGTELILNQPAVLIVAFLHPQVEIDIIIY
jgi:hypothetical protein